MNLPLKIYRIRQSVDSPQIDNLKEEICNCLQEIKYERINFSGKIVGITAGSRGIDRIPEILSIIVQIVKDRGGKPVLIPSMGTHGGSTAERQIAVLTSLGITEANVNCPILANVDTEYLGKTDIDVPVYCNVEAKKVDQIIVINRVKPHTDFTGNIESGLCKMLAIGLGSHKGAEFTHKYARLIGHEKVITSIALKMLNELPIVFGIAIAENWKNKIKKFVAMMPNDFLKKESEFLNCVKKSEIKLPFKLIDVLMIGEMGKNISGTGMDTKVIGRIMVKGQKEPEFPKIECVVVSDLTSESHGNACGIGLAEITTRKVFNKIDLFTTADNSISAMSPEQGRIPCVVSNDYEAIKAGISTLGPIDNDKVKFVYIKNTLKLENIAVSEALIKEEVNNPKLQIISGPEELKFNFEGDLINFEGGI